MDAVRGRSAVGGRVLLSLLLLGLAGILLWRAGPATLAELHLTVGDPALALLERGLRPTPAGERRLEQSRRAALLLRPHPGARRDLGLLELARARRHDPRDPRRSDRLARAENHLQRALAADPVRPEAWYALALVRLTLHGDRAGAAAALRMSYRVAPMRPTLADGRARLALLLLDRLDVASRVRVRRELELLAREDGRALRTWAGAAGVAPLLHRMLGTAAPPAPVRAARAGTAGR